MSSEPAGLRERLAWCAWLALIAVVAVRPLATGRGHSVVPIYLQAPYDWIAGDTMYGFADRTPGLDQFRYAPVFAVATIPLAAFPAGWAELAWRLLGALGFLAGFVWFAREFLPDVWRTSSGRALLLAALLPLSIGSLNNGQVNVHMVALLLVAVTAVRRERWSLAALSLTIAILCKLYPVALALLLVLRHPRPLAWRLLAMLAVGFALPFCAQSPGYVTSEYRHWLSMLGADDRRELALGFGYRDLDLLFRAAGLELSRHAYLVLQLAGAVALALFAWKLPDDRCSLHRIFDLACCWMILLGPATESCTYILLAAPLASALAAAPGVRSQGSGVRGQESAVGSLTLPLLALLLFSLSVVGTGFGAPKIWMGVSQVSGALVLTWTLLRLALTSSRQQREPLAAGEPLWFGTAMKYPGPRER